MTKLYQDLLQFQQSLVLASATIAFFGVILIGMSFVVAGVSAGFSYRLKRLGLQTLGGVLTVLIIHAVSIEVYGGQVPIALLIGAYGIIGLLLLQGLLNLVFGPRVGNGVISKLLGGLILLIAALGLASYSGLISP